MALTTTDLKFYYNPKDGKKAGNVLNNLAPGGAAVPMTVAGGTILANGGIGCDGIDDYYEFPLPTSYNVTTQPFTLEWIFTPRVTTGGDYELIVSGVFAGRFTWANLYFEVLNQATGTAYYASQVTTLGAMNSQSLAQLAFVFTGSQFLIYANGSVVFQIAQTNMRLYDATHPNMSFGKGDFVQPYKHDFHAVRVYNRGLSAAEITANWQNGIELGISTGPAAPTKIATVKLQTGDMAPLYSIAGFETEPVRVRVGGVTGFFQTVPTTDPKASRMRVRVGGVTKSIKKE